MEGKVPRMVVRPLALGWALLIAGPLSSYAGLLPGLVGFALFVLGGFIGGLSGVMGAVFVGRRGGPWGRVLAGGMLALGLVVAPALGSGAAPPINDITTDLEDPPALESGRALDGAGLPMDYDPSFAAITREAYPDLAPLLRSTSAEESLGAARACLTALGALSVLGEPGSGQVQGTFSTRVFKFRDDVVVRVRAEEPGSRVDVRSKSRDGKGDLGANAARIRAILNCMSEGA